MPAPIRLRTRRESIALTDADHVRQTVLALEPSAPAAVTALLAVLDRHTAAAKGWSFVMLSPEQNRLVVRWIRSNSKRPLVASLLWAELFCHMRLDTGEVAASRKDLAIAAGCTPSHVSTILTELETCGAITRHRQGNTVRWFMNPMVGTGMTGKAREDAQARAPQLRVVPAE